MKTEDEVRAMLAERTKDGNLRAFAREHGLNAGYLSRVANGAKLSPAILDALGLEVASVTTLYRRKRAK
jgi:hypothetical protein